MNKSIIITLLLVVLAAGGSFFAGMKYQESLMSSSARQFGQQLGGRGGGPNADNRTGFRPASREIIASDDNSITVKLADGSSKIVLLSDKTIISKSDTVVKSDLKTGEKVAVFGQENSDGSVTAQSIQLNPMIRNASDSGLLRSN